MNGRYSINPFARYSTSLHLNTKNYEISPKNIELTYIKSDDIFWGYTMWPKTIKINT